MENRALILDTDPGIDDAVALAVLHRGRAAQTKLIVAGYGNVPRESTLHNALLLRELLGWEVPVIPGAAGPAGGGAADTAAYIHGSDGLGGLTREEPFLSQTTRPEDSHGRDTSDLIYERLCAAEKTDYIALGPLTNLALLLRRHPDAGARLGRVVCMGGGMGMGNVTNHAEFNIHCDPESAGYVLEMLENAALVPLNVTTPVSFGLSEIEAMPAQSPVGAAMKKILTAVYHNCVGYGERGATMHDATAVLYYLFPELFEGEACGVTVDCGSSARRGETLRTDRRNVMLVTGTQPRVLLDRIADCVAN